MQPSTRSTGRRWSRRRRNDLRRGSPIAASALRLRWLARQFGCPAGLAGRFVIGPWLDRIAEPMNRLTLDRLDVGPSDDVLELGFGGGGLLALLLRATGGRVIGVDLSDAMVRRARRRFRGEKRLELHHGTIQALPLPDACLDRACSVNNLYFWPDPAAGMAEMARVLRPGGRLAIAFEPSDELRKWPGHRFGFRAYEPEEVEPLLEQAGFTGMSRAEGRGRRPDRFLCLTGERAGAEAAT